MSRILITGGTGYLGERLLPIASERADIIALARKIEALNPIYNPQRMDLCDRNSVFKQVRDAKPTAIIHAAAVNPGIDDAKMEAVNHLGTKHLAEAANEQGCRLVIVSTDMVHDGEQAPYDDEAAPTPVNDYGRTKARGEKAALELSLIHI